MTRPLLSWLILFDEPIRRRALALAPELAAEGGDPARLPPEERRQMLSDIVERIVAETAERSGRDNAAITRIALPDLEAQTLALIERHGANDDAVFFLGRLVWQGAMTACLPPLRAIALDPARGDYARLVSARAVLTLAPIEAQHAFWDAMLALAAPMPWKVAGDMLRWTPADAVGVDHVLRLIGCLAERERFVATGFEQGLDEFIDRIALPGDAETGLLVDLIDGLNRWLDTPPLLERGECAVSERYQWLMNSALQAVERLVTVRAPASFAPSVAAVLQKGPALRFWRSSEYLERKSRLAELVAEWPAFNDHLFWASIASPAHAGAVFFLTVRTGWCSREDSNLQQSANNARI